MRKAEDSTANDLSMDLKSPLIVLDLETTGTWVEKDRIIEIALVKCLPGGTKELYHRRVNPQMLIPKKVTELTGITNEDVQDQPIFKAIAEEVIRFIGDADLGGFNIERFDLPILERELFNAGIRFVWKDRTLYDAQKIYHIKEKRDLTAAYSFYCRKALKQAHSAVADAEATLEILAAQVSKYGEGQAHIESLKAFDYTRVDQYYDSEGRFCWWNGELYPMFGKYAKRTSLRELAQKNQGYLQWILAADFSDGVKLLVRDALAGRFPACE